MNTLRQPQKLGLIDRLIIGASILLASLLIGIQIAKASQFESRTAVPTSVTQPAWAR